MKTLGPIVATLLFAVACGDDTGGATGSGGGTTSTTTTSSATTSGATTGSAGGDATTSTGGGEGGAGGAPDLDKDPAEVTDPDECFYEGGGGANAYSCDVVTITFSTPVEAADLAFTVTTSEGHTLTTDAPTPPDTDEPAARLVRDGEGPATGLVLTIDSPPPHYAPSWVDVELRSGDAIIGAERFEPLDYACVAYSSDDWCWESEPLELAVDVPVK